ncbi:hypothetical protein HJC23_005619 [Cyclotella cryptica]|uniref:Uncharacterized protein n=1 Tax=Cyclotella cryptica TaxID=29204 RepID=A0ABD3PZE1_9STRA
MADVELVHAREEAEVKEEALDFAKILRGIEELVSGAFSLSTNASRVVECQDEDVALDREDDGSCEPIGKDAISPFCNHEDSSVITCSLSELSTATESKSLNRHVSWFDDDENLCQERSVEVKYIEIKKKTQVQKMLPNWSKKMCLTMKSAGKREQRKMKNMK